MPSKSTGVATTSSSMGRPRVATRPASRPSSMGRVSTAAMSSLGSMRLKLPWTGRKWSRLRRRLRVVTSTSVRAEVPVFSTSKQR